MSARTLGLLLLALPAAGQQERVIADAIARLGGDDPELRLLAEGELLRLGRASAGSLARALGQATDDLRADAMRFHHALVLLRSLGPEAEPALELLCELAWNGDDASKARAVRALGHLAPHFRYEVGSGLSIPRLDPVPDSVDDPRLPKGYDGELARSFFWVRNRVSAPRGLHGDSVEAEAAALTSRDTWVREFAAEALGRMATDADAAVPDLAAAMSKGHPAALGIEKVLFSWVKDSRGLLGRRIVFENYREDVVRDREVQEQAALALIRIAPDSVEALQAWAFLARFGDEARRVAACRKLARSGSDPNAVADTLRESLEDGSLHVLREAVTALGVLGPAARGAVPRLEELSRHEDAQLAARALAALRQIRGNG